MKRTAQLCFDFTAAEAPDVLVQRLLTSGLAPNAYILDLDRGLTNPDAMPAPSRLYKFPIEYMSADRREDGRSCLLLQHPGLAGLPFVQRVWELVGEPITWEPEDEFGRDRGQLPRWWHAVDLMCERHWQHLMETCHLTDYEAIVAAVANAIEAPGYHDGKCKGGRLNTATARQILVMLGVVEPADRSRAALLSRKAVMGGKIVEKQSKRETTRYPINRMARGAAGAWLMVHGVEDGWFRRRGQWLEMSPEGLCRRGDAA